MFLPLINTNTPKKKIPRVHSFINQCCARSKNEWTLKFIYSEKATKFCEISTLLLTVCTVVKSNVEISQNLFLDRAQH